MKIEVSAKIGAKKDRITAQELVEWLRDIPSRAEIHGYGGYFPDEHPYFYAKWTEER